VVCSCARFATCGLSPSFDAAFFMPDPQATSISSAYSGLLARICEIEQYVHTPAWSHM
jgi:hypothetical protein